MSDAGSNRRDRAAAARAEAQAGEKKRERMVRIVGGITVLVVVVGIIGVAVVAKNSQSIGATPDRDRASADPDAALPEGVLAADDARAYGVPYNTAADVPVLEIWEDFQCPACEAVEEAAGAGIEVAGRPGQDPARLPADDLPGQEPRQRLLAARRCGLGLRHRRGQAERVPRRRCSPTTPAVEGDGFTDEQLLGVRAARPASPARTSTTFTTLPRGPHLRAVGGQQRGGLLQQSDPGHAVRAARRRRGPHGDRRRPGRSREAGRRHGRGRHPGGGASPAAS